MEYQLDVVCNRRGPKSMHVKDPSTNTDAYYVDYHDDSDITVHRNGLEGPVIGRANLHNWTVKTDIWFENDRFTQTKGSYRNPTEKMQLPSAPGGKTEFVWEISKADIDETGTCEMSLKDAEGNVFATLRWSGEGGHAKALVIQVSGLPQSLVDEMIVSGLAKDYRVWAGYQARMVGMIAAASAA